jgi:hypothetical protein
MSMPPKDVEPFRRDWDLVDAEKLRARAERFLRDGPEGCARVAEALRQQLLASHGLSDRSTDLRRHIAWRMLLDRADEHVARRR